MEKLQVSDVLAQAFVAEGVDTLFTLMGDANMYWSAKMGDKYGVRVREAWDAAYFHSGKWQEFMYWLEDNPRVPRLHPTSGTRRHLGSVAVTALSPSTRLRNLLVM